MKKTSHRILIAPDKFKGSLTAVEAAAAIATGLARLDPEAELDLCPIADGGEGFMEALVTGLKGRWTGCQAVDAMGRRIESRYGLAETSEGLVAILEMSETAGLWRLKEDERNPLVKTTRGVGMQIAHAISEHAVDRIVLGLGGSATNDGGAGMAAGIGVRFLDEDGEVVDPVPAKIASIRKIDSASRISLPKITAACDVDNPLLGERGATRVFSPQKGASPADELRLESALAHLVEISGGGKSAGEEGAGAAGGLGFGLLHFAEAELVSGFDLIAGVLNLESRIGAADHVITGEGSIDCQSLSGKGPVALARLAREHSVPVTGFCGATDAAARESGLFDAIHALADRGLPLEVLMDQASELLTKTVVESGLSSRWRKR